MIGKKFLYEILTLGRAFLSQQEIKVSSENKTLTVAVNVASTVLVYSQKMIGESHELGKLAVVPSGLSLRRVHVVLELDGDGSSSSGRAPNQQ